MFMKDFIAKFNNALLRSKEYVIIQMHNNPDVDAVVSAVLMKEYIESTFNVQSRIVYWGSEITKPNILKMIEEFSIKVECMTTSLVPKVEILLTVDCCYGNANVQRVPAKEVYCIDHHMKDIERLKSVDGYYVDNYYQSCSGLIFDLLYLKWRNHWKDSLTSRYTPEEIATLVYYGIYTDSNSFSELQSKEERDIVESITESRLLLQGKLNRFKFSNISIRDIGDIETVLTQIRLQEDWGKILIIGCKSKDDNILGYLSDMLIEVNEVDIVVVYSRRQSGYKLSVRSCDRWLSAKTVIECLTKGIGDGGGHLDKAGGFVYLDSIKSCRVQQCKDIKQLLYDRIVAYDKNIAKLDGTKGTDSLMKLISENKAFETEITMDGVRHVAYTLMVDGLILHSKGDCWTELCRSGEYFGYVDGDYVIYHIEE